MDATEVTVVALTGFSLAVFVFMVVTFALTLRRHRKRPPTHAWTPRVTILKPLAGLDDDLLENLESFTDLEGTEYEVLLGVADPSDPALSAAVQVLRRHPGLDARIVITDPDAALNPKVAQLIGLEREATGDVVVISDSNVRVPRDYLRSILAELERPGIGLVSSVVAGTGERSLGAALENLIIGTHVAPGVLAGYVLSGRAITIGKSMAMRRADLDRVGGFEGVARVLAEDHAFARRFRAAGMGVGVVVHPVENRNSHCTVRRSLERHTRWAKIRRAMTPLGFSLEPLLCPSVVATVALAVAPGRLTLFLLAGTLVVQVAAAWLTTRLLRGRALPLGYLVPLEIIRGYVLLACWVRAWVSRTVCWRGHELRITSGTTLVPAPTPVWSRVLDYVRG